MSRISNSIFIKTTLAVSVLGFSVGASYAQVPRPSTAEPSRNERLRTAPERPQVSPRPLIESEATEGATGMKSGETFLLKSVEIEDATAYSKEELEVAYLPYLGTQVDLKTLNKIVATITAKYRNDGYILSRAVLVPQNVSGGRVKIRIIEGFVSNVMFDGTPHNSDLLNAYAEKIKNCHLNIKTLERYLLLMEDLPGLSAKATLRPSTVPGASDVLITLAERPFSVGLTADNRGTRYLGQGQGSVTLAANNWLGNDYRKTQARFLNTDDLSELHYYELRHDEQLDTEGTKLALFGSLTKSDAGYTLKRLDVIGEDQLLGAEVTHPFIRSRETNLFGSVSYDHRETKSKASGTKLYEDKLNVFRVGTSYDFVDEFSGVNRADIKVSKGFDWGNSNAIARSRAGGKADFTKVNLEASHLHPLVDSVGLLVSANGQLSDGGLLSAEQMGIGGANYGSAYDPSEITGDSGVAGRTELQYSASGPESIVPSYQLYGFYDIGKVYLRRPSAGQDDAPSLASTGAGIRFNTAYPITGGLEVAVPLTRKVAVYGQDGSKPRVFFNLSYQY